MEATSATVCSSIEPNADVSGMGVSSVMTLFCMVVNY
jgi:hypothetical protein